MTTPVDLGCCCGTGCTDFLLTAFAECFLSNSCGFVDNTTYYNTYTCEQSRGGTEGGPCSVTQQFDCQANGWFITATTNGGGSFICGNWPDGSDEYPVSVTVTNTVVTAVGTLPGSELTVTFTLSDPVPQPGFYSSPPFPITAAVWMAAFADAGLITTPVCIDGVMQEGIPSPAQYVWTSTGYQTGSWALVAWDGFSDMQAGGNAATAGWFQSDFGGGGFSGRQTAGPPGAISGTFSGCAPAANCTGQTCVASPEGATGTVNIAADCYPLATRYVLQQSCLFYTHGFCQATAALNPDNTVVGSPECADPSTGAYAGFIIGAGLVPPSSGPATGAGISVWNYNIGGSLDCATTWAFNIPSCWGCCHPSLE